VPRVAVETAVTVRVGGVVVVAWARWLDGIVIATIIISVLVRLCGSGAHPGRSLRRRLDGGRIEIIVAIDGLIGGRPQSGGADNLITLATARTLDA
jgi:hypothetical protein